MNAPLVANPTRIRLGPKIGSAKMLTPAADDAEYAKLPSFRRQGKSVRLVLLEQRLEISRVRRRDRRRLDDDKVFIVGLRIFREIIAAGHHRLVVYDHDFVVHEVVLVVL